MISAERMRMSDMPALNFNKQFAPAVASGEKQQTIRAWRKRPLCVGDRVYLYVGQRTKRCHKLGESICTRADPIRIEVTVCAWGVLKARIYINAQLLNAADSDELVRADGFETHAEFCGWFCPHGGKFDGQLVQWAKLAEDES